jgi:molybdopterin synthase sulfur carrier subunit
VRIVVMPPFDKEFFGADRLDLAPHNLFDLVDKLEALAPGFAAIAPARVHFAVDGVLETDWTRELAQAQEVIVLPRVGGG